MIQYDFAALDFDRLLAGQRVEAPRGPKLLTVSSGSRGSGKTSIAWLLAMTLSRLGHKTVLVDADLSALGIYDRAKSMAADKILRLFLQENQDVNTLTQPTDTKNLFLITGAPSIAKHAQTAFAAKQKLLLHLRRLKTEFIIVDAGAGSSYLHLDFLVAADIPIVVSHITGEALLEAYQLIRTCFFRKLHSSARNWPELFGYLTTLGDLTPKGPLKTIPDFLQTHRIPHAHACEILQNGITQFHPNLIINQTEPGQDRQKLQMILLILHQVMGLTGAIWGEVRQDERIPRTVSEGKLHKMLGGHAGVDIGEMVRQQLLT